MSDLFKKWNFLIVSAQISQRSGLRKLLLDIGVGYNSIDVAANISQVEERLAKGVVNMIITDDEIANESVADRILNLHIKNNPVSRERFFLLMVNNPTPFLMADFSLKGGNVILNKPFRNETLISTLHKELSEREKASPDEIIFSKIQDAIAMKQLDEAFQKALTFQNEQSFFALFSKALVHEARMELDLAYDNLVKVFNKKPDFKVLVKIVKIGVTLKRHSEMSHFVEKWISEFPIHHESIPDITRIIIVNAKYELLNDIFACLSKYKITDNFAKIPIAAGFVMAAVNYANAEDNELARSYAHKGIEYSCNKRGILLRAIKVLAKAGPRSEVEKVYLKIEQQGSQVEDKIFDLMLKDMIYPKDKVLKDCYKLLGEKIVHVDLYKITIECMKQLGRDPQDLIHQAKQVFPDETF
ncbi:hypothetical protein ACJVC5_16390 [Peredibacter sp. HCB2-198]|uniref:hypothetical protein n=1 Tax=Peredibacter sp. HCB2-198 TaxID=3383025 RepID=UPI0038B5E664